MRTIVWYAVAGLLACGMSAAPAAGPAKPKADDACKHGTAVEFVDTPGTAAARAKKEQKLVFVLHVSGHFEDPQFT